MKIRNDDLLSNFARRLPIVLCIDMSLSATKHTDWINDYIFTLFEKLRTNRKILEHTEIGIVTFNSGIVEDREFELLRTIKIPGISTVKNGGIHIAPAIIHSFEKIERRRRLLEDAEAGYYAPFLVLLTDGNPDNNEDNYLQDIVDDKIKEHCGECVPPSERINFIIVQYAEERALITRIETTDDYINAIHSGNSFISQDMDMDLCSIISETFYLKPEPVRIIETDEERNTLNAIRKSMADLLADLAFDE